MEQTGTRSGDGRHGDRQPGGDRAHGEPVITTLPLPSDATAMATARHWVLDSSRAVVAEGVDAGVLELLTSEVVANAVLHGTGPVEMALHLGRDCAGVVVHDRGAGMPQVRAPAPDTVGGRGVSLVDLLADSWGVEPLADGKAVWFVVSTGG